MKVNNYELVNISNILEVFADKRLPQRISYAITKNLLSISDDVGNYNKHLSKLFEEYKEHIELDIDGNPLLRPNGLPVIIDNDVLQDFDKEILELLNIEIEVAFYTIDDECFNYDDTDKYDSMTANDIATLQSFLCKKSNTKGGE